MNAMRIAFLQGKRQRERVFLPELIEQFRQVGEVVLNEEAGDPSEDRMAELARDADIAVTSWGCGPLTRRVLDRAPRLRLVLHAAGSVKPILSPELWARGIRVSQAAAALSRGVAETALVLTIASLKDMWRLSRATREGAWGPTDSVREMYGVRIGVLGAGRAGSQYIRLLRAFDVEILVYDPYVDEAGAAAIGARKAGLEETLRESDVVSVHLPSLSETYRLLNRDRLALLKDSCVLINTARGAVIDEEALAAELRRGRLFACLDVTDPEPPAPDHPFRTLPNVILLPHIAGAVSNGLHRVGRFALEELRSYSEGRPLEGEVTAANAHLLA
ncbi:hydroxyacid dehydrogenase [Cohnella xylanilytica]|uniref:hydroxyacid dehydrogenase n=1 Tax=Cohnella xylanilytica TaxID=557555 RepID=UPI001BB451E0|nr:hydroxyacid dehydrogenase [Cohnella xylanilytica]